MNVMKWLRVSDLRFIARKGEFWVALGVVAAVAFAAGLAA